MVGVKVSGEFMECASEWFVGGLPPSTYFSVQAGESVQYLAIAAPYVRVSEGVGKVLYRYELVLEVTASFANIVEVQGPVRVEVTTSSGPEDLSLIHI